MIPATVTVTPEESNDWPTRKPRRAASVSPTSAESDRLSHSAIEPSRSRHDAAMPPAPSSSSRGTPRNVITSRLARQLLTTTFIGTAERTPGIRSMRSTYDSGNRLVAGQKRFSR